MPSQLINGIDISFTDAGHGPAMVLLHGFPLDSRVWFGVSEYLQARFRVITPDLRGFGRSASTSAFTIDTLADDVHALLSAIRATPCVLAGLSMGGYVALAFAQKYPQVLRGLGLVDTKAAADNAEQKAGRMKMIETARTGGSRAVAEQMFPKMISEKTVAQQPAVVHALREIMQQCPARTIEHALLAMRDRADYTQSLGALRTPTLVVVGEDDVIASPQVAQAMSAAVPGGQLAIIPNAGHMAPMEQPKAVADALRQAFDLGV